MRITVIGATGGIGGALTRELVDRGHDVTAVSRRGGGPPGARPVTADITDHVQAKQVCADSDVVVMAAQPPYHRWRDEFPEQIAAVVAGAGAAAARLVFSDNLYMYAPAGGPITEQSPEHATDEKGRLRARLARRLLEAHARGQVRVSIGRLSDYYGPGGANSTVHALGITPALAGRRPRGVADLDQPHTFHYLPDAARGLARLVEDERADGAVWLLPAATPVTQRRLLSLVAEAAGVAAGPGVVRPWMLRAAGLVSPLVRETRSVVPQFDGPWIVDAGRFTETFGPVEVTDHRDAVPATVAAVRTSKGA